MEKLTKVVICIFCVTAIAGCGDAQLHDYVDQLNKSVSNASASITDLYSTVNDFRRDLYFEDIRLKPGKPIELEETRNGSKYNTGLIRYYSEDYIRVRLLALDALASYTAALSLLATSTAPGDAAAGINQLGEKVGDLGNEVSSIGKSTNVDLRKFTTPIAQLSSLATQAILNHVRDKSLSDSLRQSSSQVSELCEALEDDLNEVSFGTKDMEAARLLALYRAKYATDPALLNGAITDPARISYLQDAERAAKRQADIEAANPAILVSRIKSIHDEIVEYLNKKYAKRSREKVSQGRESDQASSSRSAELPRKLLADLNDLNKKVHDLSSAVQVAKNDK